MPIPVIAAGAVGATKLGSALAALKGGLGAVKAGLGAAKGFAAKRMAGQKLGSMLGGPKQLSLDLGAAGKSGLNMSDKAGLLDKIKRGFTPQGFAKNFGGLPPSQAELGMMVVPDLIGGGLAMAMTEGDIGDKLIAGTGAAAGGIIGGAGLRGIVGPTSGVGQITTEMVGGIVGDQLGYGTAENLIRMKGGGMTPQEKKMKEADALYKQQIMQELGLM